MSGELHELDLVGAAEALARRRVSSRELAAHCLARIERWQKRLNCFIRIDGEQALAAADEADRALAEGRARGPLHGVPLAHKDMYYRAGTEATCGSKIRRGFVPEVTATALARLDAAGALQLGTLNMAEFAFGPTGHNDHFGHCRNPYDPARITGGSSSGSGAAVAARLVYGALGSDTGGSIRMPASICNLVGIKPTTGRVSRFGAMPLSHTLDTVGPLVRSVRDCALILKLIAGPDPDDPTAAAEPVPDYPALLDGGVRTLRVGVPAEWFLDGLTAECAALFDGAVDAFRRLGAEIVEVAPPDLPTIVAAAGVVITAEAAAIHAAWFRERPGDYGAQVRARIEAGFYHPATRYLHALSLRGPLTAAFGAAVFGKADLMLAPVLTAPVPTIEETDVGAAAGLGAMLHAMTKNTRPINYLGLPALSVPAGFTGDGLPFGVQLVGRPFDEATLFRAGAAFERETGWGARAPAG